MYNLEYWMTYSVNILYNKSKSTLYTAIFTS